MAYKHIIKINLTILCKFFHAVFVVLFLSGVTNYVSAQIDTQSFHASILDELKTTTLAELKSKAADGAADAQFKLGVLYHYGKLVSQSGDEALKWYRSSAQKDYLPAINILAEWYHRGDLLPKNLNQAKVLFKKAADSGFGEAQNSLALIFDDGEGVPMDKEIACRYFKLAAEQGNTYAQNSLGHAYEFGKGVEFDLIEAHVWYNLAHAFTYKSGYQISNTQDFVSLVEQKMTKIQIKTATALANKRFPEIQAKLLEERKKYGLVK